MNVIAFCASHTTTKYLQKIYQTFELILQQQNKPKKIPLWINVLHNSAIY